MGAPPNNRNARKQGPYRKSIRRMVNLSPALDSQLQIILAHKGERFNPFIRRVIAEELARIAWIKK
jgi:hypothetical protein